MRSFASLFALAALLIVSMTTPAAAKSWKLTTLHNFCASPRCADGASPLAGLVRDGAGNLYGTTETGGKHNQGVVYALLRKPHGWKYRVLHDFCFKCGDGVFPASGLIVDGSGDLYGTTLGGGAHDCGIAFKLSPPLWTLTILHSFCAGPRDGDEPNAALSYAGKAVGALYDGVSPLYGVTSRGGVESRGTVFSLVPDGGTWKETVLYAFCIGGFPQCPDGGQPSGELLVGAAGHLFGNAFFGGEHDGGVTYELSPPTGRRRWKERVLYSFCRDENCNDGQGPSGALVTDAGGALLGTTESGNGETGILFRIAPDGDTWQQSVLHTFCTPPACADGYLPTGGLAADSTGAVYGSDELGGTGEGGVGGGTAFRFKDGVLTSIYQFCSVTACADGRIPTGTFVVNPDGSLIGITAQGGPHSAAGIVYELRP